MARPIDPTSRSQVEQRAKRLREPAGGWTQALGLVIARTAIKAESWDRYIRNGGDPGPLVGSFPALPETSGSVVRVGGEKEDPFTTRSVLIPATDPGPEPEAVVFYRLSEDTTEDRGETREEITREALYAVFKATADFAQLIEKRHLRLLLTPSFYREAAVWMGELLISPPGTGPERWKGETLLDLWTVPALPLRVPPEEDLETLGQTREEAAMGAGLWHFGRQLYRKLLNPRPDPLGRRGLERPELLRQLLEELGVLEPGGLKTQPVSEKALARMTTHEVPMLGFRAFPRPDKWEEAESGHGRYLHNPPSSIHGYRRWELTLQEGREDLAFASLARCQQVLEKGGLEITALHGLLCCLVMQQQDPGARFEVGGDSLLEDLGYGQARGGRDGSSRSDLLKKVAQAATLLGAVRCEGNARNNRTGTRISMEFGPMWSIAVRADGQLKLLEEPGEEHLGTVTALTLTVTPGTWVQSQRAISTGGDHLLYVPVATRVLSLGRYRQELAFRLGIHLAMGVRERTQWKGGRANVRVGQLLAEVLPKGELERAERDRDAAHKLRNKWNTALATLQQVVGFRFEFPPGHYPPALIPEDLRPSDMADPGPAPYGALELLLASRLEIHWPEPVVEAIHQKPLPQREKEATLHARQEQRAALQSRPNGARLKEALEQAKASGAITGRRQAAERLGVSPGQLSKLENGHKPLPERELRRCLALLETLKPGRS